MSAPLPLPSTSFFQRVAPNSLTILRVILAITFFVVLTPWSYQASPLATGNSPDWVLLAAAAIFGLGALTDALDGYLARRWQVESVFGRIMDPFADKLLVIGAFVYLAGPGFTFNATLFFRPLGWPTPNVTGPLPISISSVQPWMVAVILGRELLVTSIRATFEARGVAFAAGISGKLKMLLQSLCIPAILLLLNIPVPHADRNFHWAPTAIQWLVWITIAVTIWSGIPYITRALRSNRPDPTP